MLLQDSTEQGEDGGRSLKAQRCREDTQTIVCVCLDGAVRSTGFALILVCAANVFLVTLEKHQLRKWEKRQRSGGKKEEEQEHEEEKQL